MADSDSPADVSPLARRSCRIKRATTKPTITGESNLDAASTSAGGTAKYLEQSDTQKEGYVSSGSGSLSLCRRSRRVPREKPTITGESSFDAASTSAGDTAEYLEQSDTQKEGYLGSGSRSLSLCRRSRRVQRGASKMSLISEAPRDEGDGWTSDSPGRRSRILSKVSFDLESVATPGEGDDENGALSSVPPMVAFAFQQWCKRRAKNDVETLFISGVRGAVHFNERLRDIQNRVDENFYDESAGGSSSAESCIIFKPFRVYRDIDKCMADFEQDWGTKTSKLMTVQRERVKMMEAEFLNDMNGLADRVHSNDIQMSDFAAVSSQCLANVHRNVGGFFDGLYNALPSMFSR